MTSKEHKKHAALSKPAYGHFGRNEWAIVGAPCDKVKALADRVFEALSPAYQCAYIDADHPHDEDVHAPTGRLHAGATWEYSNKNSYQQINYRHSLNAFQYRQIFSQADMILVNGNHFEAAAQVVVMDNAKKPSLIKRLGQLNNVGLLLLSGDVSEPFDFIREALPHWQQLPLYRLEDTDKIIGFFTEQLRRKAAPLYGLVLAGGKSVRMGGNDKGMMAWHGREQRYYIADMLKAHCRDVYISCRPEQQADIDRDRPVLPDSFCDLGPYGAILSAFRAQPDAAWLVVACDLPLLNPTTLEYLVQHRQQKSIATTFTSPWDGLPEPLITIWEPRSYPVLLSFLSQGYSCPRKALINNDTTLLSAPDPDVLLNVNTPVDAERVKQLIEEKLRAASHEL